jgi:hypothetical protein
MRWNLSAGYGQLQAFLAAQGIPTFGRILIVMPSTDANYGTFAELFPPDPDGDVRLFTTLESAYDAATTNRNDVILLSANATHSLSTGLNWTKSRIHVVGMDGGDRLLQQGAKVQVSGAVDTAYVLKNTGVRNSFRNIKFIQSSTHANALTVAQMGGEGNLYKDVSFTFGVADNLDQATAYEVINGEDSGTFINVTFGADTLLTSAARANMLIDQVTTNQEFKSNRFRGCEFLISSSQAGAQAIKMAAAGDILFTNHFDNCAFIASLDSAGGVACTRAVSTANGTTKGTIYISYPRVHGYDDIGTNGTNNDNLYVFSHVPSAANITSAQPTTS